MSNRNYLTKTTLRRYTRVGRIVYPRKKHIFSMKDALRVLRTVYNEQRGEYLQWRAAAYFTQKRMARFIRDDQPKQSSRMDEVFRKLLKIAELCKQLLGFMANIPELAPIRPFLDAVIKFNELIMAIYPNPYD